MALDISTVVPAYQAAPYDGTNGTELLAQLSAGYTLVSDDGTTLEFTDVDQVPRSITAGQYMIWRGMDLVDIVSSLPTPLYAVL